MSKSKDELKEAEELQEDKDLIWMHGEIRTPPFSEEARIEAGFLLRRLQSGELLSMPHSRPMPSIGSGCHELRINDEDGTWRIMYHIDTDEHAIVILEVFAKKTNETPKNVLDVCQKRLKDYHSA